MWIADHCKARQVQPSPWYAETRCLRFSTAAHPPHWPPGARDLTAQLRPVKAEAEGAPAPRFAHAAAVLSGPGTAELVVVGGVNQTEDLADVHVWTV